MAQKQARSVETTEAIMRAAMKLGITKGIDSVTIRDICSEAGVSIGAFYHHFASRQELYHRTYESFDLELSRRLSKCTERKAPVEALQDLLMFQVTFVSQEGRGLIGNYYKTILSDPTHASVSPDRPYYKATYACVQQIADAGLLRPECSPPQIAELCITIVRGCLIDWVLHNQSYDIVNHARQLFPILFRGFIQETP